MTHNEHVPRFHISAIHSEKVVTARVTSLHVVSPSLARSSTATTLFPPQATSAGPTSPAGVTSHQLPRSSCPPNTTLVGLNYLKDQPPVLALPDETYPPWLWSLLDKSELPDDGPGGKAEKRRLRKENRQRIRDQNFMKTQ
ncbi:mitochondrial ribosomal protein L37-domain-containing protein [Russula dissimulans]|nr:mitochondrial ribosomal protein L37-domain-containing protein [Russula dissimulans]